MAKIASTLRRKEEKLKDKADQLERRLEMSESTCSRLMEENGELKIEIDSMEIEINEVGIWFQIEYKSMKKLTYFIIRFRCRIQRIKRSFEIFVADSR